MMVQIKYHAEFVEGSVDGSHEFAQAHEGATTLLRPKRERFGARACVLPVVSIQRWRADVPFPTASGGNDLLAQCVRFVTFAVRERGQSIPRWDRPQGWVPCGERWNNPR